MTLDEWIEREFTGHGLAMRRKEDPPIEGEPLMSMAIAKDLTRKAVAKFVLEGEPLAALEKAKAYAMRRHNANLGWWNDPLAWELIENVINPLLRAYNQRTPGAS